MLLIHVCLVANGLNHPDAKPAKLMPPARILSATIYQFPDAGRILIFEQSQKNFISTGLQPGDDCRSPSGSRFNGFCAQGKPVETGFIPMMTGFTRLKPGANKRRSKSEMRAQTPFWFSRHAKRKTSMLHFTTGTGGAA
jgi:hypothetical protein